MFYYFGEKECDFLAVKNKEVKQAIQVCYELNEDNRKREIAGLTEAMKKFRLKEGLIITYNQEDEIKIDNSKIIVKPLWKWLMD